MKILMIGAHQDDNEINCGGLAVKYVKRGHEVRFLSMCNGCGGHHIMTPEETTAKRVQDASYLLIVPHECPQAPALKKTPVIMYAEDEYEYTNPVFRADYVFDIGEEVDTKMAAIALNDSQVYEWLPYTEGKEAEVPEDPKERFAWLQAEYLPQFARSADRFRDALIRRYGEERGRAVQYAEGYEVCEYGGKITPEIEEKLFAL